MPPASAVNYTGDLNMRDAKNQLQIATREALHGEVSNLSNIGCGDLGEAFIKGVTMDNSFAAHWVKSFVTYVTGSIEYRNLCYTYKKAETATGSEKHSGSALLSLLYCSLDRCYIGGATDATPFPL